jgi:hypothetical protein
VQASERQRVISVINHNAAQKPRARRASEKGQRASTCREIFPEIFCTDVWEILLREPVLAGSFFALQVAGGVQHRGLADRLAILVY